MEILSTVPDELFSDSLPLDASQPALSLDASDNVDQPIVDVVDDIIDDVIFGYCLEIHRMAKKRTLFLEDTDPDSQDEFKIVDTPGLDVFGQELKKKNLECVCPNCSRNMAASRFAPHLEKCMGMGRCSSRVASRRIATNVIKQQEDSDNDSFICDDNDNEWGAYKKTKKLKREKHNNSPRGRGRPPKHPRPEAAVAAAGELPCQTVLDNMGGRERITLLQNICGSISDSQPRKLCTRSVRCTQHTDEQRQKARHYLLIETKSIPPAATAVDDEVHVDIDTYDDLDSQALRDALWERDLTPTASPTDSTSTINSSGSRKRGRRKGHSKDK